MATSAEIHTAIGEVLNGLPGLSGSATPPAGAKPPFAFPALTSWRPETMGRTGTTITATFDVYVITATTVRPADGYNLLQEYIDWSGPKSIYLALWDGNDRPNVTFRGLASTQVVSTEYRQLAIEEMDALQGYGGAFTVTVTTKGT